MQPIKLILIAGILSLSFYSCKKNDTEKQIKEWKQSTDFPGSGRQNAATFSIGTKGYFGLGNGDLAAVYNDLWEYDTENQTWTKKADFPGTQRAAPTSFTIGSKGYVVNGECGCNDFWEYDPSKDIWTRKA